MKQVLIFLLLFGAFAEPEDELMQQQQYGSGGVLSYQADKAESDYALQSAVERGLSTWDNDLSSIVDRSEQANGADMVDNHEPNNPHALDRKVFNIGGEPGPASKGTHFVFPNNDDALPNVINGPPPGYSQQPAPKAPEPPAPAPLPPSPPKPMVQPVIIHHPDPRNPVKKVSIHGLPDHVTPVLHTGPHRVIRHDLHEGEGNMIHAKVTRMKNEPAPVTKTKSGCKISAPETEAKHPHHEVVGKTPHGLDVIKPQLKDYKKNVDCDETPSAPPKIESSHAEPIYVKPCGIAPPGEPCYTTANPTFMPTTTTTNMPTFFPTTTMTPTKVPTTTTQAVVIQPIIVMPDVTTINPIKDSVQTIVIHQKRGEPDPPELANVVVHHHFVAQDNSENTPEPPAPSMGPPKESNPAGPPATPTPPKADEGLNAQAEDQFEREGRKMEGEFKPPCKLDEPNTEPCDMQAAIKKKESYMNQEAKREAFNQAEKKSEEITEKSAQMAAAIDPSAQNINSMLNDNPPDKALAMQQAKEKELAGPKFESPALQQAALVQRQNEMNADFLKAQQAAKLHAQKMEALSQDARIADQAQPVGTGNITTHLSVIYFGATFLLFAAAIISYVRSKRDNLGYKELIGEEFEL